MKTGILLINLGTPDAAEKKAVKRYLKEFLSDPRVIDIPGFVRWLLLHLFILPFRPKKSTHAYQQIWTTEGSPLLIESQQLTTQLSAILDSEFMVSLGMRYGNPSIDSALQQLKACKKIIIFPLFPQYSSAATGSALEKTLSLIKQKNLIPSIHIISDFYNHPGFIQAYKEILSEELQKFTPELLLFSYHGLPVRHLPHCEKSCQLKNICDNTQPHNDACYRQQCFKTSSLLMENFQFSIPYQTAFQSRLGKTPWIKPYTDEVLMELRKQGIKDLAIACPSFVTDCLETLEEIGIRAKKQWLSLGGRNFKLIPCLNSHPAWVQGLKKIILER